MEVQFTPHVQARLAQRATKEGMNPDEVVRDAVARYFKEEGRFVEAVERGAAALEWRISHACTGRRLPAALSETLMKIRWSVPAAEDMERICARI